MSENRGWDKVKSLLAKVAPVIGNAIAPGVGGAAGALVASVLGVENEPTVIESALASASPETLARLKEAELTHQAELLRISADLDKAYLSDRQNARSREIEALKAGGWKANLPQNVYGASVIILFSYTVYSLLTRIVDFPAGIKEVLILVIGVLLGQYKEIGGYLFGSSKGSADKTDVIASYFKGRG